MKLTVQVYLNTTTKLGLFGAHVAPTRYFEPAVQEGDTFQHVTTWKVDVMDGDPEHTPDHAAEAAWVLANQPDEHDERTTAYYAAGHRSLSIGDVVVVETEAGAAAMQCERVGWVPANLTDLNVELPQPA